MAGTAPFQLWLDCPAVSSIVVASGTATVTTESHFLSTGSWIQIEGAAGAAGTALNSVWQITVTSGSTFTFATSGTAGTATVGSAVVSVDLLQPITNYSSSARAAAVYAIPGSLTMSASGDGQPGQMGFVVMQDDTPTAPWFTLVSDQPRVRLAKKATGSAPAATDLYFIGIAMGFDSRINAAGQGTETNVDCADANIVLDRAIVYGKMPKV